MAITDAQKRYELKRSKQCKTYAIKYNLINDMERSENNRLNAYLTQSGQSANSYIKALIKRDLDEKGIEYDTGISDGNIDNII